jgi:hypothetical protein
VVSVGIVGAVEIGCDSTAVGATGSETPSVCLSPLPVVLFVSGGAGAAGAAATGSEAGWCGTAFGASAGGSAAGGWCAGAATGIAAGAAVAAGVENDAVGAGLSEGRCDWATAGFGAESPACVAAGTNVRPAAVGGV